MTQTAIPEKKSNAMRYVAIGLIVFGAFFASYRFAVARSGAGNPLGADADSAAQAGAYLGAPGGGASAGTAGSGSPACACCGGSGSSTPIEGAAQVDGAVQRIDIDTSAGSYNPNIIKLKAGIPTEITFPQSGGCLAQVMSKDLNFFEDLTSGPKTLKLAALPAGTYEFSCGMQMVFGSIVVE